MISFIVIGRNEGWKLTKCLESIYKAISVNNLQAEVIYVDSQSKDDSITRAKKFDKIRIFQLLEKKVNAAKARNVGAKEATGKYLFFLDGDMELFPEFLTHAFSTKETLVHPLVGGRLEHHYYNEKWALLDKKIFLTHKNPVFKPIAGGTFIIEKTLWDSVDGMDNRFVVSEDPELGLRLAEKGVLLKSIPHFLGIHHTQIPTNKGQVKKIFTFRHLYSSMLIYRKNLFNKYSIKRFIKFEKSQGVLLFTVIFSIIFFRAEINLIYLLAILIRSVSKSISKTSNQFVYYFLRDCSSLIGLFVFFPVKIEKTKLKYKQVT